MNELQIQNLSKAYGDNPVVEDVSFSVHEGEFFVLLGPSGGGKSTMLRLLCGLEIPDAGRIVLSGREITRLPSRERNIGMVFQDYGLYPHMNAFQNIAYGLEARGMPKEEVVRRVNEASAKLGITPLLQRIIVDLSGGEQQRVALARALAKDADLYLFDEPLSNLDPKLRAQARRDIQMLHRDKHKPTIYVTHDQTEAMALGDRIGIIAKGKLQQVGAADDLIRNPANVFMAGFIGSPPMNLITGKLAIKDAVSGYQFSCEGFSTLLPRKWRHALDRYSQTEITLGIRPSSMAQVGKFSPFPVLPESTFTGLVVDVLPLIGETVVTFTLGSLTFSATFQDVDEHLQPGNSLQVAMDMNELRLFDAATGLALAETA
jgi:ABC-type sugar transport system ATPase subunit